jgi:hypothetical protein
MQLLRGRGSSKGHWKPFRSNPKVVRKAAKLHRMLRAGIIKPMSKAEMRAACDAAVKRSR